MLSLKRLLVRFRHQFAENVFTNIGGITALDERQRCLSGPEARHPSVPSVLLGHTLELLRSVLDGHFNPEYLLDAAHVFKLSMDFHPRYCNQIGERQW